MTAVIVALATLVTLLGAIGVSTGIFHSSSPPIKLQRSDVQIRVPQHSPHGKLLDLTVTNVGKQTAVITGLSVTIVADATLGVCFSAGGSGYLPPARLAIKIPPTAHPGQTYATDDPHYAIAPGDAQRFVVNIDSTPAGLKGTAGLVQHVYDLAVRVISNDQAKTAPLGRVMLSIPDDPSAPDQLWTSRLNANPRTALDLFGAHIPGDTLQCYRHNDAALSRLLALPGARNPALATVRAQLAAPAPNL